MLCRSDMENIRPGDMPGPVLTWGVFDGVHLGHSAVVRETMRLARELEGTAVVMTFVFGEGGKCHPRRLFQGKAPTFIMSVAHRLLIFERMGVPVCLTRKFDTAFASLSAADFFKKELVGRLGVRGIVLGHDASFGRGRQGSIDSLRELGRDSGVTVRSCEPVLFDGRPVSSTMIREAILAGNLDKAGAMLGRPVSTLGTVVKGTGRGRTLGFPTANLDVHNETCLPGGVYGAVVRVLERDPKGRAVLSGNVREHDALVNIGTCPTFTPTTTGQPAVVEAHILGFHDDIYGREVEVDYLFRIRDERRFDGPAQLQAQLENDVALLLDRKKRHIS
ncbi:MAG: riboflavin biosynthesis protein RibF [Planctomycetota bacterium]|nr:riboflavin biosynthesis protein RibF [Planctomycetota bacterium]